MKLFFPAKFIGETESVYRSRDVRSRELSLLVKYSGETEFALGLVMSFHAPLFFALYLVEKLNWCICHVTSGHVHQLTSRDQSTHFFSPLNLAGHARTNGQTDKILRLGGSVKKPSKGACAYSQVPRSIGGAAKIKDDD